MAPATLPSTIPHMCLLPLCPSRPGVAAPTRSPTTANKTPQPQSPLSTIPIPKAALLYRQTATIAQPRAMLSPPHPGQAPNHSRRRRATTAHPGSGRSRQNQKRRRHRLGRRRLLEAAPRSGELPLPGTTEHLRPVERQARRDPNRAVGCLRRVPRQPLQQQSPLQPGGAGGAAVPPRRGRRHPPPPLLRRDLPEWPEPRAMPAARTQRRQRPSRGATRRCPRNTTAPGSSTWRQASTRWPTSRTTTTAPWTRARWSTRTSAATTRATATSSGGRASASSTWTSPSTRSARPSRPGRPEAAAAGSACPSRSSPACRSACSTTS